MKYQSDRQLDAASITSLNLTNATVLSITQNKNTTTSTVSYSQTENPYWLLEYGIVFLSFLGTVGNMLKTFYSIGRMIQFDWNHIKEFKYIELMGGKVTHSTETLLNMEIRLDYICKATSFGPPIRRRC
jgi:hypothetical protein